MPPGVTIPVHHDTGEWVKRGNLKIDFQIRVLPTQKMVENVAGTMVYNFENFQF